MVTLEGLRLCEYYQADATLLLVCTYVCIMKVSYIYTENIAL